MIDDLAERLRKLEERIERLERILGGDDVETPRARKLSAKEFLLTKNPKSEVQKVVALAFFLEHQEGVDVFNVSDLEAAFRSARERLPKNLNDAVNKNVARGFLMEASSKKDAKKAWQLTSTGERFVMEGMV
ncbi:hypothetical protein [Taklimakanibacter albus]|uniref:Uncharacterized protein n=1 Tax=Taklimakanibacter albus TaxID=2800327 RepID=A0ACC5R3X2_9HYPH|nr:hypothetical protein [Aestuariivirga sp. YIM B02566]MBK1867307.1 hypothetical protein [Aestuariivirga sp. YIM B02566]